MHKKVQLLYYKKCHIQNIHLMRTMIPQTLFHWGKMYFLGLTIFEN